MLQECPPRFAGPLARSSGAEYHRVFTSRNELGFWRAALARQNPDLMASGEGGSNTTLVRVPGKLGGIAERRELEIHAGEPERRSMAFTRTASGVCVCNLHATNDQPALAVADVLLAAEAATGWAAGAPLIFGGDLNLRPAEDPELFERLATDFGLASPVTGQRAIDHILVRGLKVVAKPTQWPPEKRELPLDGKALRLSDHAPVEARFARQDPPVLAN
jgi:endonuclease/exonuclease/phosphatase family metal-dependent hydrolase